ncbi:MAG: ATP-binding cassette domain-containing protein [Lachnospiraceae bacterium]|nr:ATP-binding cassette domain-containing protein [Lachnospiraceae bacterium]
MNTQLINGVLIDWAKISEQSYLRNINAISGINHIPFDHSVTFFVGENGSGKSTLLEAIAVAYGFNPEGGTRNYNFSTYDSHSELCDAITLSRGARRSGWGYFLRAESFYNVATKEEEYSRGPGGVPQHFHEKSHGESFLALAQNSFRPNGLYLLDEPEAALSPQRQLTLLMEIHQLAGQGAQFIIVTHSPILLGLPDAQILTFDDGPIHPCQYEETDSYQVTSMFINNRERILRRLLVDETNI